MNAANTQGLGFNGLEHGQDTKLSIVKKHQVDVLNEWRDEFIPRIKSFSKSHKQGFGYIDAVKSKEHHTERDTCFIEAANFIDTNPLRNNDYSKYGTAYIENGKKLNLKYFRNDLAKLEEYYSKADEKKAKDQKYNPFSKLAFSNYVLFMILKIRGQYLPTDDELFNVHCRDSREYNPLTGIPSVLRGELPFKVKEFDIKRAFPTFIDIELNTNYREIIYELIDKKKFAMHLNAHAGNPKNNLEGLRKGLMVVYGADTDKVLTAARFETKGQAFRDLSQYEKQYVERFVIENNLVNYVRLHDGIFVLEDTTCEHTTFDTVEFSIRECIKPVIENETKSFYTIDDFGNVQTSRTMYADFFKQERFKRISTADDKVQLLVDTNNVVDFFNHKTDIVSFLESNINEYGSNYEAVREVIAKECNSLIQHSFNLLPPSELVYYSDTKTSFGLPFKNGFFCFDSLVDSGEIKRKEYSDVSGFFAPHEIQRRQFKYTHEVGMFEKFFTRAAIGRDVADSPDTINIVREFNAMLGFSCHSYKSQTKSPCIIFTDEGANDENRNGGRGKSLVTKAISEIQCQLLKGGKEFDPNYYFVHDDLEKKHKSYVIDDVPAGFKYDDLYTNILGSINCARKGKTAEKIPFEQSPKFIVTTNYQVRYDENNASTNRRFLEYKFSDYYNIKFSPKDDFGCTFFEDWDEDEWNRFYSFVFRCVKLFLENGVNQIPYNKTTDNFMAYFNNDSMLDEFERIINILFEDGTSFGVNDFLRLYEDSDNPLKFEKMFHIRNVKKLINVWLAMQGQNSRGVDWAYNLTSKKWIKRQ
jgi:hypothetical protein